MSSVPRSGSINLDTVEIRSSNKRPKQDILRCGEWDKNNLSSQINKGISL